MGGPEQRNGEAKPTLKLRTTDAGTLIAITRTDQEVAAARLCGLNFAYEPATKREYGLKFEVNPNGMVSILVEKEHALRTAVMSPLNYSIAYR